MVGTGRRIAITTASVRDPERMRAALAHSPKCVFSLDI